MSSIVACPFTHNDSVSSVTDNRSLHQIANNFFGNVMNITVPFTNENTPSVDDVHAGLLVQLTSMCIKLSRIRWKDVSCNFWILLFYMHTARGEHIFLKQIEPPLAKKKNNSFYIPCRQLMFTQIMGLVFFPHGLVLLSLD